jgi:hypothetical protein
MYFRVLRAAPLVAANLALLAFAAAPVSAQTGPSSGWAAGPGASAGGSYDGMIDAPAAGAAVTSGGTLDVHGWFVDPTAQGWAGADNVQVFLGQMGSGGTMVGQGVVAENRPDVASTLGNQYWAASGFDVQVPASSLPAGSQTLDVYLHTPGKGWWFEPVTVAVGATAPAPAAAAPAPAAATTSGAPQVTIGSPTEAQNVSTSGDLTITGTATEAGPGPSDIDRVDVYIDGEKDTGTLLGETTPASDGSWSVTFSPTHFASTHSNIYVYAHSKSTGQETEAIRGFNIVDHS